MTLSLIHISFDTEVKDMENRKAWFTEHNGRYVIYVDVEDGKVAGYASLSRYRDRKAFDPAVEISIYVHKDYRGRGIGRSLMEMCIRDSPRAAGTRRQAALRQPIPQKSSLVDK